MELPAAYKAFLLIAGNGCEPLEGSHYAVEDDLSELQRLGRRIMRLDGIVFPSDAFVFLVHHGYAFNFFFLQDGEDPSVFEYVQGCPPARQTAACFSEWIIKATGRW
jgi:hypothetical protein